MSNPKISIIVAIAENRAIGKNNQLLWHIPEDLEHFKKITLGHVMLMGQRTFQSIGRVLPNRTTVVVSNDPSFTAEGAVVCHSLEEAIKKAKELEKDEIFICGGGSIYAQTINLADKLYLTLVKGNFEADTYFPGYSQFNKVTYKSPDFTSGQYRFQFLELEKE